MALLNVDNLSVSFVTRNGTNKAVDNVSFSVEERQITAIIGESGSGKSVSCYAMLGLVPSPPGRIDGGTAHFQGQDLLALSEAELRAIRGRDIAMIFQDPMTCLNPYYLRFLTGCLLNVCHVNFQLLGFMLLGIHSMTINPLLK